MTVAELLRRAKERIATPDRWCQHYLSANEYVGSEDGLLPDACKWCLQGALSEEAPSYADFNAANAMVRRALALPEEEGVYDWQDAPGRTHAEVMAAFDRAIALAEQEDV